MELLRQANCTAALTEGGVVVVSGGDVLIENGCFGSQAVRRTQQQRKQHLEETETGTVEKKMKLEVKEEEEEHHLQQEEIEKEHSLRSTDRSSVAATTGISLAQDKEGYPLLLFPEEAFYLCHYGWLTVHKLQDGCQQSLSLSHLWTQFLSRDSSFVEKYICYWHFRAQGWVPKCGLKFGTDFLLYKDGPAMHHSSYAVLVCREPLGGGQQRQAVEGLTWQDVAVSVRVNEAAKKEVLVCKVMPPVASLVEDVSHVPLAVEAMGHFSVHCTVVKRWVPERSREGQ